MYEFITAFILPITFASNLRANENRHTWFQGNKWELAVVITLNEGRNLWETCSCFCCLVKTMADPPKFSNGCANCRNGGGISDRCVFEVVAFL